MEPADSNESVEMPEEQLQRLIDDVHAMRARTESASARAWDIATKLSVPVLVALGGWLWSTDRQVLTLSANDVAHERRISDLDTRIDALPPQWLRDMIAAHDLKMDDLIERLAALEAVVSNK